MLTREKMEGVYSLVPTPFTKTGSFDEQAFRENIRNLCKAGVGGIATTGTLGEFHTIRWKDHQKLIKALVEETNSKIHSIAGCSGVNTEEAIMKVKYAQDCGADAAMNVIPFYSRLTSAEVVKYFRDLAEACPNIGLVVYNNPGTTKVTITSDIYRELVKIPTLCGSKETMRDFSELLWIINLNKLSVMHIDRLFVPLMMFGGKGTFSEVVNLKPKLITETYKACKDKNWEKAMKLHFELNEFFTYCRQQYAGYTWFCGYKAMCDAFNFVKGGFPRRPFIPVPDDIKEKVKKIIIEKYGNKWA